MKARMMLVAVAVLVGSGLGGEAWAICLGCPSLAWQVELEGTDGYSVHGYIEVPAFCVQEIIGFSAGEPFTLPSDIRDYCDFSDGTDARTGEPYLELWTRGVADDQQLFAGHGALWDEEPKAQSFRLPRGTVFLVGAPMRIPIMRIKRIVDRSLEGNGHRVNGVGVRFTPAQLDRWSKTTPQLGLHRLCDNWEVYCYAYGSDITLDDLVARCPLDNEEQVQGDEHFLRLYFFWGT